jgi:homocysteine S-methyltransferase
MPAADAPRSLPQLSGATYLTDSGLETDLIFNHGLDLPAFASFPLLGSDDGRQRLTDYYRDHWQIADAHDVGVVFETPTWRANPDWGTHLGYDLGQLATFNEDAASLLLDLKDAVGADAKRFVVSGNLGPRGDGYQPTARMTAEEATRYHSWQVAVLAASGVDLVTILTANYVEEGVGVANAAAAVGLPAVVSFTTETDGRLPDGSELGAAIERVDAEAAAPPAYYMVNCAHPTHVMETLTSDDPWTERIRGFRANASRMSHAELDESETLDAGDPRELGQLFNEVRAVVPTISVLGGCCGTDARHIEAIAIAAAASGRL